MSARNSIKRGRLPTHGCAFRTLKTAEYRIWAAMKTRCSNPRQKAYTYYGARGIRVCDRWLTFENFLDDMGIRPSDKHELDRIDNNGNYEPNNCRWSVKKDQARNRRNNILVAFRGETLVLSEWAERLGISYCCLYQRLSSGWSVESAFTTPNTRTMSAQRRS